MQASKSSSDRRYHWKVDAFYRAYYGGVFDEPKYVELVNGELWMKEKISPPHAYITDRIARRLEYLFEPALKVREQKSLHLADDSEPVPDVMLYAEGKDEFRQRHPNQNDVRLVIEVADKSVGRDTGEKAMLYVRAGIVDYRVSAIRARELIVFRQPSSDGYREVLRLIEQDTVRPLAAPEVELAVRDLLFRASTDEAEAETQSAV